MEGKALSGLSPLSRDARRIQRRFFSHSESTDLDSAGRVRLSRQLIEHAGLDGRCIVTGMGDRLEIWGPDEWYAEDEENEKQTPALTESIALSQAAAPPAAGGQ
jgi:MraZ protein